MPSSNVAMLLIIYQGFTSRSPQSLVVCLDVLEVFGSFGFGEEVGIFLEDGEGDKTDEEEETKGEVCLRKHEKLLL
mgnify:CR=1 FL=1